MKLTFCIIGALGIICGIGLVIATTLAKLDPLEGYSAGWFVVLGGVLHLLAAAKNYQGHWSFVIGVTLSTFGLCALGGIGYSTAPRQQIAFGIFLALVILILGVLSLWSGHRLHRCTIKLPTRNAGTQPALSKDQAACAQCHSVF